MLSVSPSSGEEVLKEIWNELIKCCICNERIAVVKMEKIDNGFFSGHMQAICTACLPKAMAMLNANGGVVQVLKTIAAVTEDKESLQSI